jgi:hypothetical protein
MDVFKTLLLDTPDSLNAITGTLQIANGGTGATSAAGARDNLLPDYTGNVGKVLTVNAGATDVEWTTDGAGTVTSVDVSGGTTGLTTSGGPVTSSGTITLAGTLAVANGGTGITSLGSGVATFLGTPSSANLAAAVTDETGTGALVFANSPTLVTPALGTPASGVVTNLTGTASININGTVGATTPSTVAATTGTFSGSVKVSGPITNAAANSVLFAHNGTDAQVWALGPNPSTQGQLVIVPAQSDASGAAVAATFNASGGNGAWGATTPSTVAATTLSASGASSFPNSAPSVIGGLSFRNRIINGDMRIDQRNEGAAVTVNAFANFWLVDRFVSAGQSSAGVFTAQRSTSTPPAGFSHFLRFTTTTADAAPAAGAVYVAVQYIEGLNVQDLSFGSSDAKTVTLSFYVRSSLTGTFSGSLKNSAVNRVYPFEYTINAANTWERKTVVVAGDTTGTWLVDNGRGLIVGFDIGSGSTFRGTAGSWGTTNYQGTTGSVRLISTLSATFDITGVQLEVGNAATEFERRPIGTELALCKRYFEKSSALAVGTASDSSNPIYVASSTIANGVIFANIRFSEEKRATPIVTVYPFTTPSNTGRISDSSTGADLAAGSGTPLSEKTSGFSIYQNSGGSVTVGPALVTNFQWYAHSEL